MADAAGKREPDGGGAGELAPRAKRAKADNGNGGGDVGKEPEPEPEPEPEAENVLSRFRTSNVLSDSAREKNIFVHGKVPCV